MKNWRAEWFYAGNMWPPLEVHSNAAPVPNARWEKEPMNAMELEGIRPFPKQLLAMKDQGLNGVGVVTNFIRHRVQPLQKRVQYGFEYIGPQDPCRVTTEELIEDEVLERIQDILQAVLVIPYQYLEPEHQNPPTAVSIRTFITLQCLDIVGTNSCRLITIDIAFGAQLQ